VTIPVERQAAECAAIRKEDNWPRWPVLPVKKSGGYDIGIVIAGELTRVWLVNMFDLEQGIYRADLEARYKSITYESVEAMVADGWMGD
jgi:hypothetical protein